MNFSPTLDLNASGSEVFWIAAVIPMFIAAVTGIAAVPLVGVCDPDLSEEGCASERDL